MANSEHLERLRQGVASWNEWRQSNSIAEPDLSGANLSGANLFGADLRGAKLNGVDFTSADLPGTNLVLADLRGANLVGANLVGARFGDANLSGTNLSHANLRHAKLSGADLSGAHLRGTNLLLADLSNANLSSARLDYTNLSGSDLGNADLNSAILRSTILTSLDLSSTVGLDSIKHEGPSSIGIDTVVASKGQIPEVFLRGCGVPDIFIQYIGSLVNQPIQYYSCFISYSTKDQDFAERLHNDLQSKGVRCWFAPHDIQAGKKIHEQIDEAIRLHDKLLLILSPSSMNSEWVNTEIAKARKREVSQNRKMLFPVRLAQFEALQEWECFDADRGKDSAREIREYYIPDFSRWKNDADEYAREFEKLLRDLKQDSKTDIAKASAQDGSKQLQKRGRLRRSRE